MEGLGNLVGNGITSLASAAVDVISSTVRAIFGTAQSMLPGGMLFVIGFVVALGLLWWFAKR